jgi:hypothetical protein
MACFAEQRRAYPYTTGTDVVVKFLQLCHSVAPAGADCVDVNAFADAGCIKQANAAVDHVPIDTEIEAIATACRAIERRCAE